jgi:hypothetical protein
VGASAIAESSQWQCLAVVTRLQGAVAVSLTGEALVQQAQGEGAAAGRVSPQDTTLGIGARVRTRREVAFGMDTQERFRRGTFWLGTATIAARLLDVRATLAIVGLLSQERMGLGTLALSAGAILASLSGCPLRDLRLLSALGAEDPLARAGAPADHPLIAVDPRKVQRSPRACDKSAAAGLQ